MFEFLLAPSFQTMKLYEPSHTSLFSSGLHILERIQLADRPNERVCIEEYYFISAYKHTHTHIEINTTHILAQTHTHIHQQTLTHTLTPTNPTHAMLSPRVSFTQVGGHEVHGQRIFYIFVSKQTSVFLYRVYSVHVFNTDVIR